MPIDSLRVKSASDGGFEALWYDNEEDGVQVKLYGTEKKSELSCGDVISAERLDEIMRPLQTFPLSGSTKQSLKSGETGISFKFGGTGMLFVTAVALKSGSAVIGNFARASTGGAGVTVKAVRPVNGKVGIFIDPPKDATGFVVLHRFDRFPDDISDTGAQRKYIPLKQYQLSSTLLLDSLESKKYFIAVFAEFKIDGEKDYSEASCCEFDNESKLNITYSLNVSKKLFGGSVLVIEFEADKKEFELPDIEIMSAVGNTPMFKKSASHFADINGCPVNGTYRQEIPLPKNLPKNTYVKAFFKSDSAQSGNQLKLKLRSNYKIS